jgi:carboxyl-terminal processing protease
MTGPLVSRGLCAVLLAAVLVLLPAPAAQAREAQPAGIATLSEPLPRESYGTLLDAVVEATEKQFYDRRRLGELGWRARAAAARPEVLAAADAAAAQSRINALLDELGASHTRLFGPDDVEYYILLDLFGGAGSRRLQETIFWGASVWYPGIGAFTAKVDGRHFIDGLLEGSPAERAGLRYGDELIAVDEQPYSPVAAFRGKVGGVAAVKYRRRADGAVETAAVPVAAITPSRAFSAATTASARVIERDGERIGYVRIWSASSVSVLRTALRSLRHGREEGQVLLEELGRGGERIALPRSAASRPGPPLDGLIVDLRGKIGGNVGAVKEFLEAVDEQLNGLELEFSGPRNGEPSRRGRPPPERRRDASPRAVLLVDHHTRSALEIMSYGWQRRRFGPVLGTTTARAVLGARAFAMPGDYVLLLAINHSRVGGDVLEGRGVIPDRRIERPLAYANGADPVLEAAIEYLVRQ